MWRYWGNVQTHTNTAQPCTGVPQWARAYGGASSMDWSRTIAVAAGGSVFVCSDASADWSAGSNSFTYYGNPAPDGALVELDASDGSVKKALRIGGTGADYIRSITVDGGCAHGYTPNIGLGASCGLTDMPSHTQHEHVWHVRQGAAGSCWPAPRGHPRSTSAPAGPAAEPSRHLLQPFSLA
jgi:hypothetical protein